MNMSPDSQGVTISDLILEFSKSINLLMMEYIVADKNKLTIGAVNQAATIMVNVGYQSTFSLVSLS